MYMYNIMTSKDGTMYPKLQKALCTGNWYIDERPLTPSLMPTTSRYDRSEHYKSLIPIDDTKPKLSPEQEHEIKEKFKIYVKNNPIIHKSYEVILNRILKTMKQ